MSRLLPTSTAAALLLAGALFASATGGAVAGSMITGKQIKDGSLTGKDVKEGSLKSADLSATTRAELTGPAGAAGLPGISGLETVSDSQKDIASGVEGTLYVYCPAGKKLLGAAAVWSDSSNAIQVGFNAGGASAVAYYDNNTGGTDDLTLQLTCARVTG